MKDKIVSADEAVAIIRDCDTLCTSGFVGVGTPDELLLALEKRYRETGHPSDLTSKGRGLNRLAHDGLVKRLVGGHWALVPRLGELALAKRVSKSGRWKTSTGSGARSNGAAETSANRSP
jgi:propionate CoA-transferase